MNGLVWPIEEHVIGRTLVGLMIGLIYRVSFMQTTITLRHPGANLNDLEYYVYQHALKVSQGYRLVVGAWPAAPAAFPVAPAAMPAHPSEHKSIFLPMSSGPLFGPTCPSL